VRSCPGVEAKPGVVQVVRNGRFAAVVAEREWTVVQALQRLQRTPWKRTDPPIPVADPYGAIRSAASQDEVIFEAKAAPAVASKTVTVRYTKPWLLHGSIGPSCAVALFWDGVLTVWTHTQGGYPLKKALVELTRLPADRVRCIHAEGSGCYGHNGDDDVAADAALVAMALPGRPIRFRCRRAAATATACRSTRSRQAG
jgi:CO/xanthine dehydrogenase Mo-binding subunit